MSVFFVNQWLTYLFTVTFTLDREITTQVYLINSVASIVLKRAIKALIVPKINNVHFVKIPDLIALFFVTKAICFISTAV